MDDLKLATLISLFVTGLFGMLIGYGICYIRSGRRIKSLKADLARRNQNHMQEQADAAAA